jgi:YHS domain-containing protein
MVDVDKDVVCGIQVDVSKAAHSSKYQERKYYFCSPGCKRKFDENPRRFTTK